MSTPNMSGRTDAPDASDDHLSASDLLDPETGRVDISEVKSITNSGGGADVHIDPECCAEIRESLAETDHAGETARTFGVGSTAVRRHAKGECHHAETAVAHPPLAHTRGEGWEVVDA